MADYIMALDQGTTSSRAIIFDKEGRICSVKQKEFTQHFPNNGWVEHDPMEIWATQMSVMMEARETIGIRTEDIAAIGITNQRETTIVWDRKTGNPVYHAIVWQCRRTADRIEQLKAEGYDKVIREKTGLIVDPYFSATKIEWILDNVPGARERAEAGELMFGTVDTWLIYKLTGGRVHATDYTNASRTMLFNIHTLEWDRELLAKFNIPESMLPAVRNSSEIYGYTDREIFGGEVPIAGVAGDQQAALFGQACFAPGTIKCTYGTGCFMLMNTGEKPIYSSNGLLTTVAWRLNKKMTFALDGGIYITGAATQWLRDGIKIIDSAAQTEQMAYDAKSNGGVYFVPAFAGLAAPHWDSYARGTMVGITGGTTREHIVRATLESTAYQVKDNLDVMNMDASMPISILRSDGGAVANNFLMQFQADILGIPVDVPVIKDTTPLGAAQLAALGIGEFDSIEDLASHWKLAKRYEPKMSVDERESLLYNWHRAVERAKNWSEE